MSTARFVTTVLTEKSLTELFEFQLNCQQPGSVSHPTSPTTCSGTRKRRKTPRSTFSSLLMDHSVSSYLSSSTRWALLPYKNFAYIVKFYSVIRISPPVIDLVVKIFAQIYIKQEKKIPLTVLKLKKSNAKLRIVNNKSQLRRWWTRSFTLYSTRSSVTRLSFVSQRRRAPRQILTSHTRTESQPTTDH